ncbi:MAG: hypothetical protein COT92_01625 [Candidatus Doudnabacteria bacterium CG10_big_fil_rev_8_21_14_0_10_42_18]|uniref:YdbS-like PH domain-containing protein n=1 Tax=Candidatus Doudnabacteria bacterium CG10_big_fil_rev_8_21_14_0_10_42_18 TaxID=1974552 RepID=A0A2H0VB69_9BACT|nr:MAG: hypothetical protein COT92_01625 [Candidatus Doudnabacteria bacterium CG10_big_fil_rev_8_21_14_0_10_42_18]
MFKTNLHPGEAIKETYRQTELVLIKLVLIIFLLIYVPWAFLIKYELHVQFRRLLLFWTILVAIYGINKYILWFLNSFIVTNRRIIDGIHRHIFQKQVIESPLERILNISFRQKGILQTLFNYGDVEVQIVGLTDPLVFYRIKNPEKVKDLLWEMHNQLPPEKKAHLQKENIPEIQQQIGYHSKKRKII